MGGQNSRRIAHQLEVDPKPVINWVNTQAAQQKQAPVPSEVNNGEVDELSTFVGGDEARGSDKEWYSEMSSRTRSATSVARQATAYFSDWFATDRRLIYPPMPDKSETYRVEGDHAEIRHDLADDIGVSPAVL